MLIALISALSGGSPAGPLLDFSDPDNSQYLAVILEDF